MSVRVSMPLSMPVPMSVLARLVLALLTCSMIFTGSAALAAPALVLDAPESVARGDAFPALAVSDAPTKAFIFRWLGKTYEARAEQVSASSASGSAAGAAMRWQAVILLPVPLEEKEAARDLAVSLGGAKDAPLTARRIALFDKDRPVQKLNVEKKYVDPPADVMARIKADRELVRQALAQRLPERLWVLPFVRPVPGDVSSLYGLKRVFNGQPRGVHKGLDLRGPQGQQVLACADGQVVLTGNLYFSGNVVYINHGEGVFTAYLHLSEILVQNGDRVRKGQVVGLVGATGRVTGPHLHLSLLVQGESVDPQPFLTTGNAAKEKNP